jgi:hypothetical protein
MLFICDLYSIYERNGRDVITMIYEGRQVATAKIRQQ